MSWKTYYIYAIRHNPTKKLYIGCSQNASRIETHLSALKSGRHHNDAMQADANKYGCDYTVFLLEVIHDKRHYTDHLDREAYWIHYYGTDYAKRGYNSHDVYKRIPLSHFPQITSKKELSVLLKESGDDE